MTQLPWSHHLIILAQTKRPDERDFYILASIKERWSKRELERQIRTQAFRRRDLKLEKVSPALAQTYPTAIEEFKNAYNLEFLDLGDGHSEADLHGALLRNLGRFIRRHGSSAQARSPSAPRLIDCPIRQHHRWAV